MTVLSPLYEELKKTGIGELGAWLDTLKTPGFVLDRESRGVDTR